MKPLSNVVSKAMFRSRGFGLLIAAGCALLFLALGMVMWMPGNVLWARNSYGMAQAGAWTGMQALAARLVYWFYQLGGRTVLTCLMLVVLGWLVWRSVESTVTTNGSSNG